MKDTTQLCFNKGHTMIETFAADEANHTFDVCALPRCLGSAGQFLNVHPLKLLAELIEVNPMSVSQEILDRTVKRKGFYDLLSDPFRSKLAPYEHEIVELRSKRPPVPYRQIVELLKEQHEVEVTINGIFVFLKTRRKWDRRSAAEKKPAVPRPVTQASDFRQSTTPQPATTDLPSGPDSGTARRKRFDFTFSDRYNLTRLTPEEAAALEKKLDEELKGES